MPLYSAGILLCSGIKYLPLQNYLVLSIIAVISHPFCYRVHEPRFFLQRCDDTFKRSVILYHYNNLLCKYLLLCAPESSSAHNLPNNSLHDAEQRHHQLQPVGNHAFCQRKTVYPLTVNSLGNLNPSILRIFVQLQ